MHILALVIIIIVLQDSANSGIEFKRESNFRVTCIRVFGNLSVLYVFSCINKLYEYFVYVSCIFNIFLRVLFLYLLLHLAYTNNCNLVHMYIRLCLF